MQCIWKQTSELFKKVTSKLTGVWQLREETSTKVGSQKIQPRNFLLELEKANEPTITNNLAESKSNRVKNKIIYKT